MNIQCDNEELPVVEADFCAPDINFGQVDKIYLGNIGNPLTDWSQLTEWDSRIDNDSVADATPIRMLHVIGSKPLPETSSITFSQGRKANTEPKHTVNIKVDETGEKNYTLVRWLEDNVGQQVAVWYQAGKYLYGGNAGIPATLALGDVIPESNEELNTFDGTVSWEGKHPERILNPMA